jgi:hypothetical protein
MSSLHDLLPLGQLDAKSNKHRTGKLIRLAKIGSGRSVLNRQSLG